jgi:hypothetical protein
MNRRIHNFSIVKDDRAVALTEFAIVIPVVLLFFLAILQYFVIVRTYQLVNYAAYAAARSYAVHASEDGPTNATATATDAAAWALAPVANLVPGEVFGITPPVESSTLFQLGEGFIVARYVRLNPYFGGNISIITNDNPDQVEVEINYPQPIYLPGLSGLWGFVGGGSNIHQDLMPLQNGLGGIIGVQEEVQNYITGAEPPGFETLFPGVWGNISTQIGNMVGSITKQMLPYPYINVHGKCCMEYESWGSQSAYSASQQAVNKYTVWTGWGSPSMWQARAPKQ